MSVKKENIIREALADMFGILEDKVRNGSISFDDVNAIVSLIEANGGISATVSDLARFYHQSEDNVRHVLHRSYMPKPKRRVYYDMLSFTKNVPARWREKPSVSTDSG